MKIEYPTRSESVSEGHPDKMADHIPATGPDNSLTPHPSYLVIQTSNGAYSNFPIAFVPSDRVESEKGKLTIVLQKPYKDKKLTESAREIVAELASKLAEQKGLSMCVVFGERDCVYCEPDGSMKESDTLPSEDMGSKEGYLVLKGISLANTGKYQEAIACYNRALEIKPRFIEAWDRKGRSLFELGRYKEALVCTDKLLEIDVNDDNVWFNRGFTLAKMGKPQEAIACYDRALEVNPRFVEAWKEKGRPLMALDRNEEAIPCLDNAIEISPRDAEAWHMKGLFLRKPQERLACYDRALEINPRDAEAWRMKGLFLAALGRFQEAIVCFKRFVECAPPQAASAIKHVEEITHDLEELIQSKKER